MSKTLYIVIPCYNEQEVLPETSIRLLEKLQGTFERLVRLKTDNLLFLFI